MCTKKIVVLFLILSLLMASTTALADYSIGSRLTFGSYPQTKRGNDSTPISWTVVSVNRNQNTATLISDYVLDCVPYNGKKTRVNWDSSSLNSWLNETFLNRAFSYDEQRALVMNSSYEYVFILSDDETWDYFWNNDSRRGYATSYVLAQGCYTNGDGNCPWWVRSDTYKDEAGAVRNDGKLIHYSVNNERVGVRPSITVNLSLIW